ncbi:hypothetical protein K443DRAFT_112835, partial [Laccaria amethystina LaAM-08-1]
FRKLTEGATTFISWEKSPKREIDTERLQKNTDRLKKLQKLDIDYVLFFTIEVCSVRFLRLQKVIVSTFQTTKVCICRVYFLRLQKFIVSAFQTTKVCSVRFFRLQKFVVSAFLTFSL